MKSWTAWTGLGQPAGLELGGEREEYQVPGNLVREGDPGEEQGWRSTDS